jgi:hypothetical protein
MSSETVTPQKDRTIRSHEPVYRYQHWTVPDPNKAPIPDGKVDVTLNFGANATLPSTRTWMLALEAFTANFDPITTATPSNGLVLRISGIGSRETRTNMTMVEAAQTAMTVGGQTYHDGCSAYFPINNTKTPTAGSVNYTTTSFSNMIIGERISNPNFLNSQIQIEVLSGLNMMPVSTMMSFSLSFIVYEYKP